MSGPPFLSRCTAAPPEILALRRHTPARIGLGRAGAGLPTAEHLRFAADHARARDAVWTPFDETAVEAGLRALGIDVVRVASEAENRETYLRRPDLGRRLAAGGQAALANLPRRERVALVVADGLSAAAVHANAVAVVEDLLPGLAATGLSCTTAVLAREARVALGDAIASALGAELAIVLIGERPGLSAADSLGCYVTFAPRPGTTDAARNCVSNIRADGLPPHEAARRIAWLAHEAVTRRISGVALKDASALPRAVIDGAGGDAPA